MGFSSHSSFFIIMKKKRIPEYDIVENIRKIENPEREKILKAKKILEELTSHLEHRKLT